MLYENNLCYTTFGQIILLSYPKCDYKLICLAIFRSKYGLYPVSVTVKGVSRLLKTNTQFLNQVRILTIDIYSYYNQLNRKRGIIREQ